MPILTLGKYDVVSFNFCYISLEAKPSEERRSFKEKVRPTK